MGTADPQMRTSAEGIGPINVSPKGGVPLHIIDRKRVAFLDYLGSGNKTADHTQAGSPITVLVCSFESEDAAIVRLYGRARIVPLDEYEHAELLCAAPSEHLATQRQAIEIEVETTGTSCGYGVPVMELVRQRRAADRGRKYK